MNEIRFFINRLGPEEGWVPSSSRQRSIGIMMYLRYSGFRKREVNGLNLEDQASKTLYRRCPVGFAGISCTAIFDEQFSDETFILYVFY